MATSSRPEPISTAHARLRRRAVDWHRWRSRLELRSRITIGFSLVAAALCIVLTAITYLSTRSSLVDQELKSVASSAVANALIVQSHAHTFRGNTNQVNEAVIEVLTSIDLSGTPPTLSMLKMRGRFISDQTVSVLTSANLPTSLRRAQRASTPYQQVFSLHGATVIGVAVPIASIGATYFEVFRPTDTVQTLHQLLATMIIASAVAIVLAGILGRWAATRVLRPLTEISNAALEIAGGRLQTRIETRDESDLARLAASFNKMVEQLQERIVREARFTSDVAHELRSPLTTLATSLSVLESHANEMPKRIRQALDLLSGEVRRFERMVRDLLEISRFDSGTAEFQPTVVTVGEVIRRALEATGAAHVELEIPDRFERRRLIVDKRRFERVIANLVENANRYADGPSKVLIEGSETQIRFIIEDRGPGVDESERERIFERFARGASTAGSRGRGDGTGLGLALVTEHVRLHAGRVWVEDNPGGGARFVVQLPLQAGALAVTTNEDLVESAGLDEVPAPVEHGVLGEESR